MNSWTGDVEDTNDSPDESDDDEEQRYSNFPKTFEKTVRGTGHPKDISESDLKSHIDEVDDETLLREGWLQLDDGPHQKIIENRIGDLGGSLPDGDDTEPQGNSESEGDSKDSSTDAGETDDQSSSSGGWGGTPENEMAEEAEEAIDEEDSDDEDEEVAQPSIESMDEMAGGNESSEAETDSASSQGGSGAGGPPTPSSSVSVADAAERDRRWKMMVWGPPKLFKTHFCYTMPEPIAYIDLESKADDLSKKFRDKEVQIWQPKEMTADPDTKFRRAKKALDEALEWLDWYRQNQDRIGTIVVDSMSLMWEWAQRHHKIENYPLKDPEDVDLSANFKSSQESDWAVVKEYHNGEFRERICDSPFHFCWTAMERVDFERQLDDESDNNVQFMEPRGESTNVYKADTVIHARKDANRGKVGDMTGSNFTDNAFVGLKKPTFPKVRDAVEKIESAEAGDLEISRGDLADEINSAAVIDHDPQKYVNQ